MPRVPILVVTVLLAAPLLAQEPEALRVPVTPSSPTISRVAARGDTVYFWQAYPSGGIAYVFDRRRHRFDRALLPHDIEHGSPGRSPSLDPRADFDLVDSLRLSSIDLPDDMPSRVIRAPNAKTIALRGPRVAAERRWRVARGLPAMPRWQREEFVMGSIPTDWAPIDVQTLAIDESAIWLGLAHEGRMYDELALGGLMRVDRRTHAVTVLEDSAVMHTTVSQMQPVRGGYLLLADGKLMQLDTAARTVREVRSPGPIYGSQFFFANDTVFLARGAAIEVVDLLHGRAMLSSFRLTIVGDSIIYTPVDSASNPPIDVLAALGVAEELGVEPLGEWMRVAVGKVQPIAFEYYFPGDRQNVTIDVDSLAADSSVYSHEELEGPNALFVRGLDHPALRPFLRRRLHSWRSLSYITVARILLEARDTASIPDLRAALDSGKYPHTAEIATALAELGDSTGYRWVRAALVDTLRLSAPHDTAEHVHPDVVSAAGRLRDPANVTSLLDHLRRPRTSYVALRAVLAYPSIDVWRRTLVRLMEVGEPELLGPFMAHVAADTTAFVEDPELRNSVRLLARRTVMGPRNTARQASFQVFDRYADPADFPWLIAALTMDEFAYASGVTTLVRLTAQGVEAMPDGRGTLATRAAAQRWWSGWYSRNARTFRPPSREASHQAVLAMSQKLNR